MRDHTPMTGVLIVVLAIASHWPAMVTWIPNLLLPCSSSPASR
ncbi:MAG: hypothetical protein ACHQ7N_00640 [Candidatus Methylomirabilales bacterium]